MGFFPFNLTLGTALLHPVAPIYGLVSLVSNTAQPYRFDVLTSAGTGDYWKVDGCGCFGTALCLSHIGDRPSTADGLDACCDITLFNDLLIYPVSSQERSQSCGLQHVFRTFRTPLNNIPSWQE